MDSLAPSTFGEKEADRLLALGWGQGQVLEPASALPTASDGAYFVVCTHSCSVVSKSLDRDPWVEIAEARQVSPYKPKSSQARGRDVRKFHLPVNGAPFEALEIDINIRHPVKRELLLSFKPAGFSAPEKARREFAGWIARYYSRIALPNELVARLRKTILVRLKEFLEYKCGNPGIPRHELIERIFIQFEPNIELPGDKPYRVGLKILCEDHAVLDEFDKAALQLFGGQAVTMDDVALTIEFNAHDETFLSDVKGWIPFTDWDHLSGMWEAATASNAI